MEVEMKVETGDPVREHHLSLSYHIFFPVSLFLVQC